MQQRKEARQVRQVGPETNIALVAGTSQELIDWLEDDKIHSGITCVPACHRKRPKMLFVAITFLDWIVPLNTRSRILQQWSIAAKEVHVTL
jgi:hypothetical protein